MFADSLWYGAWVLSTFWAWFFTLGLGCLFVTMVVNECVAPAAMFTIVLLLFSHLIGAVDVLNVVANPLALFAGLILYLLLSRHCEARTK